MTGGERTALVTGGSRGVGRAIVRRLAADGHLVIFSFRNDRAAADELVAEVAEAGGRSRALPADLREPGAAEALATEALASAGVITVAVSNAGMASRGLSVPETPYAEYLSFLQLNSIVIAELARVLLPGMRAAGQGSIVAVTSTLARTCPPLTGPYAASKAAAEALVRVLAMEERRHGVRVNSVAPGLVATDMGDRLVSSGRVNERASELDASAPLGRVCRPEDVADAVAYLAAPNSYVTGHRLVVDGGGPAVAIY